MFTSNQRQWKSRSIDDSESNKFKKLLKETNISHVMSHGSYLVNLGSTDESLEKSRQAFKDEIIRCHKLGVKYLNFHPGSHLKRSRSESMDTIIESVRMFSDLINQGQTEIIMESTAGQGTNLGYTFEELKYMLNGIEKDVKNIGICLDTCHMFAAGYDIRDEKSFKETFDQFESIVGIKYLKAFHVNDSKVPLGSRVDRHESLGQGFIGWKAFQLLMQDSRTKDVPKYLETPNPDQWKFEIGILRSFYDGKNLSDLGLKEGYKIEDKSVVKKGKKRSNESNSKGIKKKKE